MTHFGRTIPLDTATPAAIADLGERVEATALARHLDSRESAEQAVTLRTSCPDCGHPDSLHESIPRSMCLASGCDCSTWPTLLEVDATQTDVA